MEINIDDDYLDRLGVIKSSEYREHMSSRILNLLNQRLAIKLSDILTDDQLEVVNSQDEDERMDWLKNNVPDFEELVKQELEQIVVDVNAMMPKQ